MGTRLSSSWASEGGADGTGLRSTRAKTGVVPAGFSGRQVSGVGGCEGLVRVSGCRHSCDHHPQSKGRCGRRLCEVLFGCADGGLLQDRGALQQHKMGPYSRRSHHSCSFQSQIATSTPPVSCRAAAKPQALPVMTNNSHPPSHASPSPPSPPSSPFLVASDRPHRPPSISQTNLCRRARRGPPAPPAAPQPAAQLRPLQSVELVGWDCKGGGLRQNRSWLRL